MAFADQFRPAGDLTPILETVLDAVVVISPEGVVTGWNTVAEQTFGWRAADAIGQQLSDLIIPAQHRQAHEDGMARIVGGAPPRVLNRRIEITALTRDRREFPIELSITTAMTAAGPVFVGFLRDITARRRGEEALERQAIEARLQFDIARMAAEADSFEAALEQGLAAICRLTGWPVGHALTVVDGDPPRLQSLDLWFEEQPGQADALREATAALDWTGNPGLPGRILVTREPLWVDDTGTSIHFVRRNRGFGGAFGFPLLVEDRVIAVLEFFSRSPVAPNPELLLSVRTLGEQVGRVFERRRRQDREGLLIAELNHRAKNLLMVVQAVAGQSFREGVVTGEAQEAFMGRLSALAGSHDLLMASDLRRMGLRDIVGRVLETCGVATERVVVEGPNVRVPAARATAIVLAVHELCTNAHKHGALSASGGQVSLTWQVLRDAGQFEFEWREHGGPPVAPPQSRGFGSTLISRVVAGELGGKVESDFLPDGLRVRFTASLPARR